MDSKHEQALKKAGELETQIKHLQRRWGWEEKVEPIKNWEIDYSPSDNYKIGYDGQNVYKMMALESFAPRLLLMVLAFGRDYTPVRVKSTSHVLTMVLAGVVNVMGRTYSQGESYQVAPGDVLRIAPEDQAVVVNVITMDDKPIQDKDFIWQEITRIREEYYASQQEV